MYESCIHVLVITVFDMSHHAEECKLECLLEELY